jgi:hypothetical protein
MAGQAELFTVCSSCGQQVSTFVTECPYCGTRLQKRAPRLDRKDGDLEALLRLPTFDGERTVGDAEETADVVPLKRRRRLKVPGSATTGPRSRPGSGGRSRTRLPGRSRARASSSDYASEGKAYATFTIVVLALIGLPLETLLNANDLRLLDGAPLWRSVTAALAYGNTWNAVAVLTTFGVFGWLWERRAGLVGTAVVLVSFLGAGVGGLLLDRAAHPGSIIYGGAGAAVALAVAWIVCEIRARRAGESLDGDLQGAAVLLAVPVIVTLLKADALPVALGVGLILGSLLGLGLSLARR